MNRNSCNALILIVASVFCAGHAFASTAKKSTEPPLPIFIISDVDDTVKITDVEKPASAIKNGIFRKKFFGGMAKLYQEILKREGATATEKQLHFLSGSPDGILNGRLGNALKEAGFPPFELTLKNWRTWGVSMEGTKKFKKAKLEEITTIPISQSFILISDDTELDPEAFTEFQSEHANVKIGAIYIHRVARQSRILPAGVIPYFTAFDIAIREFRLGHMSEAQVKLIGEAVLNSPGKLLSHEHGRCPKKGDDGFLWDGEPGALGELQARVTAHILASCGID